MSICKIVSQGSGKAATIGMSVVADIGTQWCIHTLHLGRCMLYFVVVFIC